MEVQIFDQTVLFSRLRAALSAQSKPIVFLLGSALSYHEESSRGVPTAAALIEAIREELLSSVDSDKFENVLLGSENRYQEAFKLLLAHRGQDHANQLVFSSVLKSLKDHKEAPMDWSASSRIAEQLEESPNKWYLTPGLVALSKLILRFPKLCGKVVLTTNFDPLIEAAIRIQGGQVYRTSLTRDGNLLQTTGSGTHVVHLHGYWHGTDTLHTALQLSMERAHLEESLKTLSAQSTVVVIGYGGWDDVFTRSLAALLGNDYLQSDVLWAFHEEQENIIREKYAQLMDLLGDGAQRGRVHFYSGIDCHKLLPNLVEAVTVSPEEQQVKDYKSDSTRLRAISTPDSPPKVDVWVGRHAEYESLKNAPESVIFVTGIGGQGKSALASKYLASVGGEFVLTDWRDCREEGDTLQSQLLGIIERVTNGEILQSEIGSQDLGEIVKILFAELGSKKCLFIFDNVDHYVDLATFEPTNGLDVLVNFAKRATHKSQFIFTCRPVIKDEASSVYVLHLMEGLTLPETEELFKLRGCKNIATESLVLARDTTNGHPLWLNLLATQVSRRNASLEKLLNDIEKGRGELPEKTLRSIWRTVSTNEHLILRTMSEMVRSETEENIAKYVSGYMNWNRYSKSMRALKGLNLIVVKPQTDGDELLELHPLVKQFIQKEFPRQEERERFILTIITYIDKRIGTFKGYLQRQPSFQILDHWIQKVELDINRGHYAEAIETLYEVGDLLTGRGYPENFVRVARKIFAQSNWTELQSKSPHFTSVLSTLVKTLAEFGDDKSAEALLVRYREHIGGKGADYINYCNLKSYWKWIRGSYPEAITIAEEGVKLKKATSVDTNFDCGHNLALAKRDSGKPDEALEYFLHGSELTEVVEPGKIDAHKDGAYYGNIGRCLQLRGKYQDALECYRKSLSLLREMTQSNRIINLGYAYYWIGQVMMSLDKSSESAIFFEAARRSWNRVAPTLVGPVIAECTNLTQKSLATGMAVSDAELISDVELDEKMGEWLLR